MEQKDLQDLKKLMEARIENDAGSHSDHVTIRLINEFEALSSCDNAFPQGYHIGDRSLLKGRGMSLRDYFAAKALVGVMGLQKPQQVHSADDMAHDAYEVADAMLKARAA